MSKSVLIAICGFAAFSAIPAVGSTATFNFANDTASSGNAMGNILTETPDSSNIAGLTDVTITSFNSNTTTLPTSGNFATTQVVTAATDLFNGYGLGACSSKEGQGCGSPQHQVDNTNGAYEFMLFKFSTPVNLTSISLLDYSGSNMDMSYWTGNSAPVINGATTISSLLSAFSSETTVNCSSGCGSGGTITDSLTVNGSNVQYLLVAAAFNSGTADDTFKIQSLVASGVSTATPEPATFGLIGFSLAGLGMIARRRNRK